MSEPLEPTERSAEVPGGEECREVAALLEEFVDGELPVSRDTEVREHLAICGRCRGATEHQRAFLRRIERAGGVQSAPEALRQRIRALLADDEP